MKLIDLTHTLKSGLPVYPGDAPVSLARLNSFSKDGYSNFRLCTGMHAGTHIDGPMHLTTSNTYIAGLPLESFCGEGIVIDVRDQKQPGINSEIITACQIGEYCFILLRFR